MTDSRTLTLATLREKGACPDQIALFKRLFGDSVEVTEALAAEHAGKFNVEWAANHLLSPQAQAAYYAVTSPSLAAYEAATARALAAYEAATARAWAAYDAATARARDAYDAATARAWARAYINDK